MNDCPLPLWYVSSVKNRSRMRFLLGLIYRYFVYLKYSLYRTMAKMAGAKIGDNTVITFKLAYKANSNLSIGNNVIIETNDIDLRAPIVINDNVIINKGVSILRVSHNIDNDTTYSTKYYPILVIDNYSWLATGCKLLPSVTKLSKGTVCAAYSVLHSDTDEMGVYSGNPALLLKYHNSMFTDMLVPYLKTCDYKFYKMARRAKCDVES